MNSFEQLEENFQGLASYLGLRITSKPLKNCRLVRVLVAHFRFCGLLTNLTFVGFLYVYRDDLLLLLTGSEVALINISVLTMNVLFWTKSEVLVEVIEWCKSRHVIEDPHQHRISRPSFRKALQDCEKAVKWLQVPFLIAFLSCIFIMEGFKLLMLDEEFPLPYDIYYFGVPATDVWSFGMNFYIQVFGVASNVGTTMIFQMWIIVTFRHVFASLEAAQVAVESMGEIVDELSFDEWLKIVHGFLTDATLQLRKVGEFASMVIYLEQKTMFTVLFVGWLTVRMDPGNLPNAFAFSTFVAIIFVICRINEVFKQKYQDINFALYEIPWYDLKPRERRLLVPLMVAAQNHPVLRAGGLDEMTYQNFLGYIKGAYSTAILMEELIYAA